MSSLLVGSVVRLDFTVTVDNVLTDPSAVTVTVEQPDGTLDTGATVNRDSTGTYHADYVPSQAGTHIARWVATGTAAATDEQPFDVRAAYSTAVRVDEVKQRLNKDLLKHIDDDEIGDMLDAALAEYAAYVGPLPGTRTETFDGGGTALVLTAPDVTAITAAEYDDGTTITLTDLTVRNGIVRWGYGTAGRFTTGRQNVQISYTVGSLPANHRETIIADVAGYFAATQRSGSARPQFAGEAGYDEAYSGTPRVLFPRIRELAASVPRIA